MCPPQGSLVRSRTNAPYARAIVADFSGDRRCLPSGRQVASRCSTWNSGREANHRESGQLLPAPQGSLPGSRYTPGRQRCSPGTATPPHAPGHITRRRLDEHPSCRGRSRGGGTTRGQRLPGIDHRGREARPHLHLLRRGDDDDRDRSRPHLGLRRRPHARSTDTRTTARSHLARAAPAGGRDHPRLAFPATAARARGRRERSSSWPGGSRSWRQRSWA